MRSLARSGALLPAIDSRLRSDWDPRPSRRLKPLSYLQDTSRKRLRGPSFKPLGQKISDPIPTSTTTRVDAFINRHGALGEEMSAASENQRALRVLAVPRLRSSLRTSSRRVCRGLNLGAETLI